MSHQGEENNMRKLIVLCLSLTGFIALNASAQDVDAMITDIVEDVLAPADGRMPVDFSARDIDIIPVQLKIEPGFRLDDHHLIITAHSPTNVLGEVTIFGENRVAMTGLTELLNMFVVVPKVSTSMYEQIIIRGRVEDSEGEPVLAGYPYLYEPGGTYARLSMESALVPSETFVPPSPDIPEDIELPIIPPSPADPDDGERPVIDIPDLSITTEVTGSVSLADPDARIQRRSRMFVRLVRIGEGDADNEVLSETEISLDGRDFPVPYTLDRQITPENREIPYGEGTVRRIIPFTIGGSRSEDAAIDGLGISAEVVDWAGRTRFRTIKPLIFQGEDQAHNLILMPAPRANFAHEMTGEVYAPRRHNLPAGSTMTVEVLKGGDFARVLASRTMRITHDRDRSGFAIGLDMDPFAVRPEAVRVKARVNSPDGALLYYASKPASEGFNRITLNDVR